MKIAKYNGKIGLYKTNRVAIYKPVSGTMSVGYDNVTPSPYVNTNYYFMFKHKFDTIYTGSITNPTFRDIYAPVDGFVVNGGLKIKL